MTESESQSTSIPLKVIENKDDTSFYSGTLAEGCKHCIKGGKLVLFITGLCPQRCFYCPVSEDKFAKDRIFANEREITTTDELIDEAKLINATGAGITGGDPLTVPKRCVEYVQILKKEFGKDFHTHLYTPMKLVTRETLKLLYDAGLDEIRFHPDLDDDAMWDRIKIATQFDWDIGIEIPCIPDREVQTKKLLDFAKDYVTFFNLNELEYSDTTVSHYKLSEENFVPKNDTSYGVQGSSELARELIRYNKEKDYSTTIYFCPSRLKDKTQMGNRMKRRANNVKLIGDIVTNEGTLIRGIVYLKELTPGFSYKKEIELVQRDPAKKQELLAKLKEVQAEILDIFKKRQTTIDENKFRIIISKKFIERNFQKLKQMGFVPAVVEEYPSHDSLELEIELL